MKKMFSTLSVLSICLFTAQVYNTTANAFNTKNPATNNVGIGTSTSFIR